MNIIPSVNVASCITVPNMKAPSLTMLGEEANKEKSKMTAIKIYRSHLLNIQCAYLGAFSAYACIT